MNPVTKSLRYQRVVLKVSGEFFIGNGTPLDPARVKKLATEIVGMVRREVQVAVVLGAGNFCRGGELSQAGVEQITADQMGMLATVINALALKDALMQLNTGVEVYSAFGITGIVSPFMRDDALNLLENGFVVICAGGTGNPLVTTDTAAALRAIELGADLLLKATKVDGVYSADPKKNPNALRFAKLTFQEVITQSLEVMDLGAFCLCRDHRMPIRIFDMESPGIIDRILSGVEEGTLIN